jgi:hypothetical protein
MVKVEAALITTGGGAGSDGFSGVGASGPAGVGASGPVAGRVGEDGGISALGALGPQPARSVTVSKAMARMDSNLLGIFTT